MNDFEKIEHLLLNKRFEELSPTEVREVTDYFENATDYNDMRDTLMQVKSTLTADKLLIKPSVDLKEKLLQQFDKTYTKQANTSLGTKKPFYKNIAIQWAAAASVVIIISVSIFGYIHNLNSNKTDGMAANYEPTKKENTSIEEKAVTVDGLPANTENKPGHSNELSTTNPPNVGVERSNNDVSKNQLYGNFYTTESMADEGEVGATQNAPVGETNIITFSTNRSTDNTTLGGSNNADLKEEKRDDVNYYGDNTTLNKQSTQLKDEDKAPLSNTTIPLSNEGKTNTTVGYESKISTKKEYWSKKKNKSKLYKGDDVKTELSKATNALATDTLQAKQDSLGLDSNKKMLENNGGIQMNDNKK